MKLRDFIFTCTFVLLLLSGGPKSVYAAESTAELFVGVSVTDITPDDRPVHDPLLAKVLAFRQGDCRAALVVCDQIIVRNEFCKALRAEISERSGIAASNVSITASHTHTGRGQCEDALQRIVKAVERAFEEAVPCTLDTGTATQEAVISFNRRFLMKDGTIRFNPGVLNPNIVRPVGPIDTNVEIILARNADTGKPLASLTNFALHLDTVGKYSEYSADYPFYLQQSLQKEKDFGDSFVSVFGTGCCGDVNHVDVTRPNRKWKQTRGQTMLTPFEPKTTEAEPSPVTTEYIGQALASTFCKALPDLRRTRPMLGVRHAIVDVPLSTYSHLDLEWAKSLDKPESFLMGVRARRTLSVASLREQYGESMPCEVHVFRLTNDTAIVTLPGEVFVELGLAIKKASPFDNTLVIELANTEQAVYVPTRKAFIEGDYEVVNSRLECGGGEMLVDTAVRMLQELKPHNTP